MPGAFARVLNGAVAAAAILSASSAGAETLPAAIVQIDRPSTHTEIRLQMQPTLVKVCFAATGANSPYLLASGRKLPLSRRG